MVDRLINNKLGQTQGIFTKFNELNFQEFIFLVAMESTFFKLGSCQGLLKSSKWLYTMASVHGRFHGRFHCNQTINHYLFLFQVLYKWESGWSGIHKDVKATHTLPS